MHKVLVIVMHLIVQTHLIIKRFHLYCGLSKMDQNTNDSIIALAPEWDLYYTVSELDLLVAHIKKNLAGPGWCGSVDWVPACEPKGCQFDFQSGHMPRLWAMSPVGGVKEVTLMLPFLPPFPSLPL